MNPWNLMAGGAAIGVVASLWDKIKAVAWRAMNLFVQQIEIPTEAAHDAVIAYLIAKYKRSRAYDRMYGATFEHQRDGRYALVPYEVFGHRTIIFWNGLFPFFFANAVEKKTKGGNQSNNSSSSSDATKVYSTITYVRGMLDVEAILREACSARNSLSWSVADAEEAAKTRFRIHFVPARSDDDDDWSDSSNGLAWYQQGSYRLLSHTPEQLGKAPTYDGRALDNLIFPKRVKDLIREIELWRKSQTWYRGRGIPWKRGWLLYGPPGTGKTALARAFAEDLNMPIYVFNLSEMGNHELVKAWTAMQVNVPCIALFEDIDNVFHGRENVARKGGFMPMMMPQKKESDDSKAGRGLLSPPLTFDCLLNCLDGVERADGIFTIITTNDIGKIDPALGQPRKLPDGSIEFISTRPGRVDKAVELGYMEPADKKRMARRILDDYPKECRQMMEFIDRYTDLQETPAQFQERCGQIALACFWKDKHASKSPTTPSIVEPLDVWYWADTPETEWRDTETLVGVN